MSITLVHKYNFSTFFFLSLGSRIQKINTGRCK